MIPKDEICRLRSDENTVDKRTEKLWRFFKKSEKGEKLCEGSLQPPGSVYRARFCGLNAAAASLVVPDRVTESEFIQGVLANEAALRLIQYQPLK